MTFCSMFGSACRHIRAGSAGPHGSRLSAAGTRGMHGRKTALLITEPFCYLRAGSNGHGYACWAVTARQSSA